MLKFDRPTLVTITAPTCSGKSYLLNALTDLGAGRIVSTTTRAKREGETEGIDYNFISVDHSKRLEEHNAFFELIEFRGTRYGVTNVEMDGKMSQKFAPIVILEPKGLEIYTQKCRENSWDIFKVYVHVTERVRIDRLMARTVKDVLANSGNYTSRSSYEDIFNGVAKERYESVVPSIIKTHTDRLLSIVGEERGWSNTTLWDAIIPGDNLEKALADLEMAVKWRNRKNAEPTPYDHYAKAS